MAIIKCKMCGGDLRIEEDSTVCECEYCGTRQTVPSADNEKKLTLFSRAGRLLRGCEFDKAAGIFEAIVADFPEEAEAYWGLVLCKYGIEYVDDPATGKKIPTCHRSSFDSVLDDPNYEQACENTDAVARRVYRDEARQIEDLRKRIIEVSGKEEPYDIFISYKETNEHGDRTLDSVIAQDIYTELTEKGYRVFFARISLEDKLGTEYEPYIFAALNSAKVMLVVGTDYENFDSVWVKNEWSRFLKLIASGQKKTLIPVFKNMDAYDMPKEFAKLAAQDMGKVGAMQDLVRGVEKIIGRKNNKTATPPTEIIHDRGPNVTAIVKRGFLALESADWNQAKEYFNNALNINAESAEAYLGLFLAEKNCRSEDEYIQKACSGKPKQEQIVLLGAKKHIEEMAKQYAIPELMEAEEIRNMYRYEAAFLSSAKGQKELLEQAEKDFEEDRNINLAFRFAEGKTKDRLERLKSALAKGLRDNVSRAVKNDNEAKEKKQAAYAQFLSEVDANLQARHKDLMNAKETQYQHAKRLFEQASESWEFEELREAFLNLEPYKDSEEMVVRCEQGAERHKQLKLEQEKRAKSIDKRKKLRKRFVICLLVLLGLFIFWFIKEIVFPSNRMDQAIKLVEQGEIEEGIKGIEAEEAYVFSSSDKAKVYALADALMDEGSYEEAVKLFSVLGDYEDSTEKKNDASEMLNH